jgi:hypothetical protein
MENERRRRTLFVTAPWLCYVNVYAWIANEKMAFPRPTKLTANIALFLTAAVDARLAERGLMQAQGAA